MAKLHDDPDIAAAMVAQEYFTGEGPKRFATMAKQLGVDKATISRLLKRARERGLIEFSFNLPREKYLELRLAHKYEILDAAVFPVSIRGTSSDRRAHRRLLAASAARYIERAESILKNGQKVGISCGGTLRDLIHAFTPQRFSEMTVFQLTVETESSEFLDCAPVTLVGCLYGKWNGEESSSSKAFAVQPLLGTLRGQNGKPQEPYRNAREKIEELANDLDVALVGISYFGEGNRSGTFFQMMERKGIYTHRFENAGTVGEICNRPFDAQGRDLFDEIKGLEDYVDGVGIKTLQERVASGSKVVAIAGGKEKAPAIRVALKHRIINYLITDTEAAETLCEEPR